MREIIISSWRCWGWKEALRCNWINDINFNEIYQQWCFINYVGITLKASSRFQIAHCMVIAISMIFTNIEIYYIKYRNSIVFNINLILFCDEYQKYFSKASTKILSSSVLLTWIANILLLLFCHKKIIINIALTLGVFAYLNTAQLFVTEKKIVCFWKRFKVVNLYRYIVNASIFLLVFFQYFSSILSQYYPQYYFGIHKLFLKSIIFEPVADYFLLFKMQLLGNIDYGLVIMQNYSIFNGKRV